MSQQQSKKPSLQFNLGDIGIGGAGSRYLKNIFDYFDKYENKASKTTLLEASINEYQGEPFFPEHQAMKKNMNAFSYGNDTKKAMEDWPNIKKWITPDPEQPSNINTPKDLNNLNKLFDALELPEISKDIANFLHCLASSDDLTSFFEKIALPIDKRIELMAVAIGRTSEDDLAQIKDLMNENGPFHKFGIINNSDGFYRDEIPPLPALDKTLLHQLNSYNGKTSILHHLIGETVPTDDTIPLDNFDLASGQKDTLNASLSQEKPYSLLLGGPPGTGKTELCKTLAKQHDKTLIKISLSDIKKSLQQASQLSKQAQNNLSYLKDHEILRAHTMRALKLAEDDPNIIIFIDEAEKILPPYNQKADNEADKEALHAIITSKAKIFFATNHTDRFTSSFLSRLDDIITTKPMAIAMLQKAWLFHAEKHGLNNLTDDDALYLARNYPNIDSRALSKVMDEIKKTMANPGSQAGENTPLNIILNTIQSRSDISQIAGNVNFTRHFTPEIFVAQTHNTPDLELEKAATEPRDNGAIKKTGERFLEFFRHPYPRSLFLNTQPQMGEDELIAYIAERMNVKTQIFDAGGAFGTPSEQIECLEMAFSGAARNGALLVIKNIDKIIASDKTDQSTWDQDRAAHDLEALLNKHLRLGHKFIATQDSTNGDILPPAFKNKFTEQWTLAALPPAQLKTALTKMLSFSDKDLNQWDDINNDQLNKTDIRPGDIMALTTKIEAFMRETGWQAWENNPDKAQIIADHLVETQKDRQPEALLTL